VVTTRYSLLTMLLSVSNRDVKTSDLVAQIAEILGTQGFDSPYDYIAADVNNDGEHDVRDVVASSTLLPSPRYTT